MPEREGDQPAQDIVDRILATEQAMEEMLRGSREEAQAVKTRADKEATRILSETRTKTQELIRDAVREAEEAAEGERRRMLDEEDRSARSAVHQRPGEVEELVKRIADMILSTGVG